MSEMNSKKFLHNTTFSVQLPYIHPTAETLNLNPWKTADYYFWSILGQFFVTSARSKSSSKISNRIFLNLSVDQKIGLLFPEGINKYKGSDLWYFLKYFIFFHFWICLLVMVILNTVLKYMLEICKFSKINKK